MLRLRPLRPDDEAAFRAGHDELAAQGFTLGLFLEPDLTWAEYLRIIADYRAGANLPDGYVPGTFLVADVDSQIVGRVSIRHELNAVLLAEGGHIGYVVLEQFRGRGYATEMLRQGLIVARSAGVDRVLVICGENNIGSSRVIEANGGKLEPGRHVDTAGHPIRRYWID